MDLQAYPSEPLREKLAALGIARERQRAEELLELLPARLDGKPYDLDPESLAKVLVYLTERGLVDPTAGLAGVAIGWGERLCHFYRSDEELYALACSYFRRGLRDGERCMWVLRGDAPASRARKAIAALPDMRCTPDELEVVDAEEWFPDTDIWTREEERAVARGYTGLRICGEAPGLERGATPRVKLLATYPAAASCETIERVISAHDGVLVRGERFWRRLSSADPTAASTILSTLAMQLSA